MLGMSILNVYVYIFNFWIYLLSHAGSLLLRKSFSSCNKWASHCGGFSCCGPWALGAWTSAVVAGGPRVQISSCDSGVYLPCGMWNPPRPGLKPTSPVLAYEFLTIEPPGKSHGYIFKFRQVILFHTPNVGHYSEQCLYIFHLFILEL